VHEGAAIGSISARAQIAVAGSDRATYLQGLLTNDIVALADGAGCYAAWLSPQGRMLTDMHVLQSAGMILLDVPLAEVSAVLARLDQFLFSEDVRIESLAEAMTGVWVHGPQAASVIERVLNGLTDPGEWLDYQHATATFDGNPVSVARIDQLGVPGYCVFLARTAEAAFVAAAADAGAKVVGAEALQAARIEAGYPLFGVDMTDDTIPLEAGIDQRAISFTKGCFVGQEVVIRVLHRGGGRVVKKLVGLKISDESAAGQSVDAGQSVGHPLQSVGHPFKGAKVFSGEREIGALTSVATSPRFGVIALGYVHRDFTSPGTDVQAGGHPATVVALPMV
jgi:folate-binding protein YgfZ